MTEQRDIVTEARELEGWAVLAMPPSVWPDKATFDGAKRIDDLLRLLADECERLQRQQAKVVRLIEAKRDGTTQRYAYGGYSRELWHLNVETLNTVCRELLKEVTDNALVSDTDGDCLGNRTHLDAGAIQNAEEVKP